MALLILRSVHLARVSKDEAASALASWFETALKRLLTMRDSYLRRNSLT
jgi:hypothetical protein